MNTWRARVTDSVRDAGMSGSEIARRLHVARSSVSQKLSGRRRWSLEDAELLAEVLPPGDRLVLVPERETLAFAVEQAKAAAPPSDEQPKPTTLPTPDEARPWSDVPLPGFEESQ